MPLTIRQREALDRQLSESIIPAVRRIPPYLRPPVRPVPARKRDAVGWLIALGMFLAAMAVVGMR